MAVEPQRRLSPEQYLALERASGTKSEYVDGEMVAMTGASRRHNLLTLNVASALHGQLRGRPCEAYKGDMRLRIPATGLYTYPDVVVVCGEPELEDAELDTLLNPTLVVEVLSPTTESYDRGKKFAHYRMLPSLREYVLVAQDEVRIELFSRQADGQWVLSEADRLDARLALSSIGCELVLADVYERLASAD